MTKFIIDLHADELLETTAGMTAADILEYQLDVFRRTLEQYKAHRGKKTHLHSWEGRRRIAPCNHS